MAESVLIVGVNDQEDQLAALQAWFEQKRPGLCVHRGHWEAVQPKLETSGSVALLSGFWGGTGEFKTTIESRNFDAYLFLLDSNVEEEGDGELFLAGLLKEFGGEWWAAVLSGKIPDVANAQVNEFAEENSVPPATLEQHYLGASQDWLGGAKSLSTQILQRLDRGESLQGWRPKLARAKPDQLRAVVHWLASLALPLELDLQTLQERSAGEPALAELIWEDYFGASAESYLGERSTCHEPEASAAGGMSLEAALELQWDRLSGTLDKQEGMSVKSAFDEVRSTLVEVRGRAAGGVVGSLETVVTAIRGARKVVELLLTNRCQEQE